MKSLQNNPYSSLCDETHSTFHKLVSPDGSIVFSTHSNLLDLLASLTNHDHQPSNQDQQKHLDGHLGKIHHNDSTNTVKNKKTIQ